MSDMEDKLIVAGEFKDYISAEMAKQSLEDAGIKVFIDGDDTSNIFSGISAIKGPSLMVFQADAEKAGEILAQMNNKEEQ